MSGFAGFFDTDGTVKEDKYSWIALVRRMAQRLSHRGSGGKHTHISACCALTGVGTDSNTYAYTFTEDKHTYHIVLDGKITNHAILRNELISLGSQFETDTDAELVLKAYLRFHMQCPEKLDGAFSFVIDDGAHHSLFLCRDRFGIKPLFYTLTGGRLVFASEIKGLFEYPGVRPTVGRTGLCSLFGFGGIRTPGCGIFEDITEIRPGHYAVYDENGFKQHAFWQLQATPFSDTSENALQNMQLLITHAAAEYVEENSIILLENEYSDILLQSAQNQCEKAIPFTVLEQDDFTPSLRLLTETAIARDLPTYSHSHLELFSRFRYTAKHCMSALSSVGAAEIFSPLNQLHFEYAASVLHPDVAAVLDLPSYIQEKTAEILHSCPVLRGESTENRRFRQQKFASIQMLLPHALECADRYSAYCGLQVNTPFMKRELIEYFFNLPQGLFGSSKLAAALSHDPLPLLKKTATLPSESIIEKLTAILHSSGQPVNWLIDTKKAETLLHTALPEHTELLLWLLQLDLWMNHYRIRIQL